MNIFDQKLLIPVGIVLATSFALIARGIIFGLLGRWADITDTRIDDIQPLFWRKLSGRHSHMPNSGVRRPVPCPA